MTNGKKPLIQTEDISFTAPLRLKLYLRKLVRTGCYGAREGDAAHKIVSNVIEEWLHSGRLKELPADYEEDINKASAQQGQQQGPQQVSVRHDGR